MNTHEPVYRRVYFTVFFLITTLKILSVNDDVTYYLNDDGDYRCYINCTQDIFPIVLGPLFNYTEELDELECPF